MMNHRRFPFIQRVAAIMGICVVLIFVAEPVAAQSPNPQQDTTPFSQPTPVNLEFPETTETPEPDHFPALYEIPLALSMHDHFYFDRPLVLDELKWPTSDFRFGYFDEKTNTMHTGLDIVGSYGQTVYAVADGEVIFSGYGLTKGNEDKSDPYGIAVVIKHSFSFEGKILYTVYGHFSEALVKTGQQVNAGDPIGLMGLTGNTSGPHVHFEVRVRENGEYKIQNPELWFAPPIGHGVLVGQIKGNNGVMLNSKVFWLKSLATKQSWTITSYSQGPIDRKLYDDYFKENFVLNDLPEGSYEISAVYNTKTYKSTIYIAPGATNYVVFNGKQGFSQGYPIDSNPSEFLH